MDGSCAQPPDERTADCPMSPQGLLSLSHKEGSVAGRVTDEQAVPEGSPSPTLISSRSNPPHGNAIPWEHSSLQACQRIAPAFSKVGPKGHLVQTERVKSTLQFVTLISSSITLAPPLERSSLWVPTQGQTRCSSLCQTEALLRIRCKPGLA